MEKKRKQDEKRQRKNDRKAADLAVANAPPVELTLDEEGDSEAGDVEEIEASSLS
ncbi:MAG: hypothetical protein WBD20_15610 [Pirellulaceae bacterium]